MLTLIYFVIVAQTQAAPSRVYMLTMLADAALFALLAAILAAQ
jgi:hypothetical protein